MNFALFATGSPRKCLFGKMALVAAFHFATGAMPLALAAEDTSAPDVDEEQIDSTGLVWAAKVYGSQLYTYDGKAWTPVPNGLPPDAHAEFRGMAATADGAVAAAWVVAGEGLAVTRHVGPTTTLLGAEKGVEKSLPDLIHLKGDSKGRVWMSGAFPRVYRTDGKGGITVVREFTPEDFRSREKKRMLNDGMYNPIQCEEDGLGRMWVWSGTYGSLITQYGKNPNLDSLASLHSVFLFSDNGVEEREDLGPVKGGDFYAITRFDDRHMIASDSENGVYKLDIQNGKTESFPGFHPWELRNVHELFVKGGDIYAIDNSRNSLWRWSGQQWNELAPEIEVSTLGNFPRIWLPVKDDLIVQAFQHESWFVPQSGPARRLSWKSGFPIPQLEAIVQLKDGTFCVLGNDMLGSRQDNRSRFFHCELPDSAGDVSSHRIEEVEPDAAWLNAGHIWMIPRKDSTVLKEWDGKTWLSHPIPNNGRGDVMLNEDQQGMIWVYNYDGSAGVFDPTKNQWWASSGFDNCLAATKGHPVHFQHLWRGPFPRYSSDKQRIAYYADTWQAIHYFDGSVWRIFKWTDISGWPGDNDFYPPWFDEKDKLCVSNRAGNMTWQCDDQGKWSSVPYVAHPSDAFDPPQIPKWELSATQKTYLAQNASTARTDSLGGLWFTNGGKLYRCVLNQWVSVFAPDEVTPFASNPILLGVDVDPQGNAFINVLAGETRRYLIRAKHPAPQTTITLKQLDADSLSATFDPHCDGKVQFGWQLDDGKWTVTGDSTITVPHLTNGPHTIRAFSLDDQLNMDASVAEAHCEVKIDVDKQTASLIAQLFGPDYDLRKQALQTLASEPQVALPALLKAKATATEDQLWWIQATIQQIESKKASGVRQ
jgi:hypothetical protein